MVTSRFAAAIVNYGDIQFHPNALDLGGLSRRLHEFDQSQAQRRLSALEPVRPAEPGQKPVANKDADSRPSNPWTRTLTPTQLARNPTGPMESNPEGPAEVAVPARHLPRTGHIPRDRAQVRLC